MHRDHRINLVLLAVMLTLYLALMSSLGGGLTASAQAGDLPPGSGERPEAEQEGRIPKESPNRPAGVPVQPVSSGGPDGFGYTWSDVIPYDWVDATSGTLADLTGDDKVVGPISIGFDFPFYEHTYSQLYISSNGLVTFETPSYSFANRALPFIVAPKNLIAPFWDDLHVPAATGGAVYYYNDGSRFTIAWHNVARYPNETDLLTFEVVLYPNGNICYQYRDLNGILDESTVGIEDADGVDGLTYLNNAPGLDALVGQYQVCFQRPAPEYRVKMLPVYQGGLVVGGSKMFYLEIINTGDQGSDSYEIEVDLADPSWTLELKAMDGTALTDSDNDGLVETRALQPGESLPLRAKLSPPDDAGIGDNTLVDITSYSQHQPTAQWSVQLRGALPVPFVQGLVIEDDISLYMIWKDSAILPPPISSDYTGSTIGVTYLPGDRYLYLWEHNDTYDDEDGNRVNFTDLEFAILNGFGTLEQGPGKITSNRGNSTYTHKIADRSPVAAVTANGEIGLAWVRRIYNSETRQEQSNVYFVIYDADDLSAPQVGPINVTQNTAWSGSEILDVPVYGSPRIAVTNGNRFSITWSESRMQEAGNESSIGFAAYTLAGQRTVYLEKVPGLVGNPGQTLYQSPDLIGLSNGENFISFLQENVLASTFSVGYLAMDADGVVTQSPTLLPGVQGLTPVATQFSSTPILLAWINPHGDQGAWQIDFVTLDPSSYAVTAGPTSLVTPNGLSADLISVSQDNLGNASLTWMDSDIEQSIYYALVSDDGTIVTPPVQIFVSDGETITVSKVRASNATYIGKYHISLPLVAR